MVRRGYAVQQGPGLWPDRRKGPFYVTTYWDLVDDRLECVGLDVRSFTIEGKRKVPGPSGLQALTATQLRALSIESRRQDAIDVLAHAAQDQEASVRRTAEELLKGARRPRIENRDHYRRVAEVYAEAFKIGRAPTRAVAEHFDAPRSTAAKWVAKARVEGYLEPKPGRGRAGGVKGANP